MQSQCCGSGHRTYPDILAIGGCVPQGMGMHWMWHSPPEHVAIFRELTQRSLQTGGPARKGMFRIHSMPSGGATSLCLQCYAITFNDSYNFTDTLTWNSMAWTNCSSAWLVCSKIQQLALSGSSSSLHSEACNALGASDGVIHSRISLEEVSLRAYFMRRTKPEFLA